MKKFSTVFIIFGILCFIGIIVISAESEFIPDNYKTFGFMVLGYLGVISFTYGWLKRSKK